MLFLFSGTARSSRRSRSGISQKHNSKQPSKSLIDTIKLFEP
jgi:hypothetical protein